jgi:hypothetical protein
MMNHPTALRSAESLTYSADDPPGPGQYRHCLVNYEDFGRDSEAAKKGIVPFAEILAKRSAETSSGIRYPALLGEALPDR